MYEISKNNRSLLAPYYKNSTDSSIYSVLQGYMGRAFVDDENYIKHTILLQGDFIFPSGIEDEFDESIAMQMLEEMKQWIDLTDALVIPQNIAWHSFLLQHPQVRVIKRYAMSKMRLCDFDRKHLEAMVSQLPNSFTYQRFDESICDLAMSMDWSEDFCVNFESSQDFMRRGLGVAILIDQEFVCGASSYTVYDQGIEVEITTKPAYRRMGLASCCAAKLMLECMKEGKIPNWDAANQTSVAIAQKLGFSYLGDYDTFVFANNWQVEHG